MGDWVWYVPCGRLGRLPVLLRTINFADEKFRDDVLSSGDRNTYMRISGRDDRASSCNHDIDLVIGKALVLC